MECNNLGALDHAVLLFGGSYSNAHATRALIDWALLHKISKNHRIMTGDTVAYCAHPNETIDLLRGFGAAFIAGNCEKQLANNAEDCGCGFDTGSVCDLLSISWYRFASQQLRSDLRQWMQELPDIISFTHQGLRIAVIHGGISDVSRFLWPNSPDAEFESEIKLLKQHVGEVDLVVAGHCGFGFSRQIGAVTWINAGTIGLPENNGDPRTCFAVLEDKAVQFHRLSYDYLAASQAMAEVGLGQGYHASLRSGYWPSEETLPPALRRN